MVTDQVLSIIGDYVANHIIKSEEAYETARLCLKDAIGCATLALKFPECKKLLGPIVQETTVKNGSRVIGTLFVLDPVQAAFNMSCMIRWLDYNDTFLGKEWAHPSDNIGAILAIADYLNQTKKTLTMRDVLTAIIKTYEIQGILALQNSFNSIGLDHVILVKVATAAVTTELMGGNKAQIIDSLSNAFIDTGPLRTYRHFPNTGSRKSWAAGDQAARGVYLSMMTMRGEMGYSEALTAKKWGLYDVLFAGVPFDFKIPLNSYIIENILFKVSFPAEFHAQTAVECAISLHTKLKHRLNEIATIEIQTQEPAIRIIDKKGALKNHADRDHCLQYMVAVALIKGSLSAEDYKDELALNPMIDFLRDKMVVIENKEFTKNYYDLDKRSIGNSITVTFIDGTRLDTVSVEYPLGHKFRRVEALSFLQDKFKNNLMTHYKETLALKIVELFEDQNKFDQMPVSQFMEYFISDL